jgi:hypothetical protein
VAEAAGTRARRVVGRTSAVGHACTEHIYKTVKSGSVGKASG